MFNILFYGDSNTWGYDPESGGRYPYGKRWTSICADILGAEYNCIPAGLNGRTTAFDDPVKRLRNGVKGIDIELQTHKPLDLAVIMLGTNDLKYRDAALSAWGMERLIRRVVSVNERYADSSPVFPETGGGKPVLLISPVLLECAFETAVGYDSAAESKKLAESYEKIAAKYGTFFMNAAEYAAPSEADGVHLGVDGHGKLGRAAAEKIKAVFAG